MLQDSNGDISRGFGVAPKSETTSDQRPNDMFPQPHQELTLSYMCEKEPVAPPNIKGKETAAADGDDHRFLERDFLQLGGAPKRRNAVSNGLELKNKKIKPMDDEAANLSLSPLAPALDLRLDSSNQAPRPAVPDPNGCLVAASRRVQSSNNSRASSDDFTAPLSHSCSHPFSHNISCSLTRDTTENFESSKDTDGIWYTGEGTNGSVHSRFKPLLDNYNLGVGVCRAVGTDINSSFFPSTLPARSAPRSDGGRSTATVIRPEHILNEIISGSVPVVARMIKELPGNVIEAVIDYLRSLITDPSKGDELAKIQLRLERKSDLTLEVLLKSNENQLDILVAVKTGVDEYLRPKVRRPSRELVEIFLLMRCRNAACNSELPVDNCDCRLCMTTKGFCSSCMCMICKKFDCALSTCTWVGCDVCSHWCHAICGIQKNLIRPGPSLKGVAGTTEVLSYCLGCGHASEMIGFAKAVFESCAKDWGLETLKREINCIMQIFQVSVDTKGKQMHCLAGKILNMLEKKCISSAVACDAVIQFLNYGKLEKSISQGALGDALASAAPSMSPKPIYANATPLCNLREVPLHNEMPSSDQKSSGNAFTSTLSKVEGFESMESMVRFKQAEAALFQRLADEASREVEGYRQMVKVEMQKLEEEYARKLALLCFKETEERRHRKQEELKLLEVSLHDYYTMKKRMEAEMASLLQRMERTKQLVPL